MISFYTYNVFNFVFSIPAGHMIGGNI